MKKKSVLTLLAATTAFSGVAAVSQPYEAEAATSAKSLVVKAEKAAQKLAAEIDYTKRKKAKKSPVGLPSSKLHKETKAAYNKALAAVKKTKGNEKKVLQARLASKVKPTLDRTAKYITAVNAGKKLLAESKSLEKNVKAYKLDSKTKKSYQTLSANYKKLTKQINSVYGTSTRTALKKEYLNKITPTYKKAQFAFNFKSNTDKLAQAVKDGNYTKAQSYVNVAKKMIADNKKNKYATVTSTLYKKLIAAYTPVAAKVSGLVTTYKAVSTDATNPTVFGGTEAAPLTINHDVIIEAGKDKYVSLKNVIVNGNIIIKGDVTGAGTVTLDNVTVNAKNSTSGQIIVDDVAEHSLYLIKVKAVDVVVNDGNGSNIVAKDDTKVGNLIVSEKAGENGKVTLESVAPNAFASVTIIANSTTESTGIVIKGDYSNVKLVVVGDQKITIAPDAKIGELEVQSNATVTAEKGAVVSNITIAAENKGTEVVLSGELKNAVVTVKNANATINVTAGTVVGEIKKDSTVTDTVKIENKGTIEKAEQGISVDGNKPNETTQPSTPSTGGGGGGGSTGTTVVTPVFDGVAAEFKTHSSIEDSSNVVDLSSVDDSDIFKGITINTPQSGVTLKITSLTARGSATNWISTPLKYPVSNGSLITTEMLFGALDTGTPGITMSNMRAAFLDNPINLTGTLVHTSGGESSTITIQIKLGKAKGTPVTSFTSDFGTITKNGLVSGKHKITVEIDPDKKDLTIGDIDSSNPNGISFTDLLLSFASSEVDVTSDSGELASEIAARSLLSGVKLSELAGRTFETTNYTVEFLPLP